MLKVRFFYDDNPLYEYECLDVAGLYKAIEKSETLHFDSEIYEYDNSLLNHYTDESGQIQQELLIYLKEFKPKKPAKIRPKPFGM